eukprot:1160291-Pelagomonas_calceolata.AAC.1
MHVTVHSWSEVKISTYQKQKQNRPLAIHTVGNLDKLEQLRMVSFVHALIESCMECEGPTLKQSEAMSCWTSLEGAEIRQSMAFILEV